MLEASKLMSHSKDDPRARVAIMSVDFYHHSFFLSSAFEALAPVVLPPMSLGEATP